MEFSKRSLGRLGTCEQDIQVVLMEAIEVTKIDFGISEGHRAVETQQEYWRRGRDAFGNVINKEQVITNVDGVKVKGKHNYKPSKGVDIYAFVDGQVTYEDKYMFYLAGLILGIAHKMGVNMENGGFWRTLKDVPHFETD
jgi:peptidoglycan L-alanyl-D-glutamate endopeptidase CwlK